MSEERRTFNLEGVKEELTLTELRGRLNGCPTKHVLAVWEDGGRQGARTGSGDDGAPIVNEEGELIGMQFASIQDMDGIGEAKKVVIDAGLAPKEAEG